VNEVTLLFYGQPEKLTSALLLNLNIIDFREETPEFKGLYILENKFGKTVTRKISLDFEEGGGDWLIYRYLSEEESAKLKRENGERRIYVLLQNYMTIEYFRSQAFSHLEGSFFYIAGQGEGLKTLAAAAERMSTKNVLFVKTIRKKAQENPAKNASTAVPDFMATFVKLLLNPVDEFSHVSKSLMHSNQRVLYRLFELFYFIHFVVVMSGTFFSRVLMVKIFWKSVSTIGVVKTSGIKLKFFIRHIFLMLFYKTWGVFVDTYTWAGRVKDRTILNVYYRAIHKIYYKVVHSMLHTMWLKVISPAYYKVVRPFFISLFLKIEKWFFYRGVQKFLYVLYSAFGFSWEKFFSPLYFATIHRVLHSVLRPSLSFLFYRVIGFIYYRIIVFLYYKITGLPYYKVTGFIYYRVILLLYYKITGLPYYKVTGFIYYRVILLLYYKITGLPYYKITDFLYYRFIHRLYYLTVHSFYHSKVIPVVSSLWYDQLVTKFYYGIIHRIGTQLRVTLFYRVWPWLKFHFFIRIQNFLVFKVRHFFLMALFKSYGLAYDLVMFAARVTKLYLLYPFFKVYWFTSFQYTKRIKKFLA